jgi:hypothetical protein
LLSDPSSFIVINDIRIYTVIDRRINSYTVVIYLDRRRNTHTILRPGRRRLINHRDQTISTTTIIIDHHNKSSMMTTTTMILMTDTVIDFPSMQTQRRILLSLSISSTSSTINNG